MATKRTGRGGARAGAGRKASDGAVDVNKRYGVVLDKRARAQAMKLGSGSVSAGIREALRLASA